jgi:hypothetical protein
VAFPRRAGGLGRGADSVGSDTDHGRGDCEAGLLTPRDYRPRTVVVQLEPHKYAVAIWRREEDGEPIYEIIFQNIRDARVAVTMARGEAKRNER